MARSDVFIEAGNDYREVSIGGRRNSHSGYSWINFDYFKEGVRQVPDRRYKKQEVFRDEVYKEYSNTTSVTTRVWRGEDGRASITAYSSPPIDIPQGILSYSFNVNDVGISVDPWEVNTVFRVLKEHEETIHLGLVTFTIDAIISKHLEFKDEVILKVYRRFYEVLQEFEPNRVGID